MKYMDNNTGYFYTEEELRELFEQFRWEMKRHYDSFEEYLEYMIQNRTLVEVEPLKMHFRFEAAGHENILWGQADDGFKITASVTVPEGASEDYGYLTMKSAIMMELDMREIDTEYIDFQYDGQEDSLADDADAEADVLLDIED